jgi:predicted SAM-dependent methyltransferase
VILEYLSTLARARALWLSRVPLPLGAPRLHLGCGDHRIEGWVNADVASSAAVDVLADGARGLPFGDGAVAFIHCEDLLEHLDREDGLALLAECFRALRRGGVLRILTPDLRALVEKVYAGESAADLAWCTRELSARGPCQALNMHLRMNGAHRFVYDSRELTRALTEIGFRVAPVAWNASTHAELRYLDLRDFGLSLFMEATRPGPPQG